MNSGFATWADKDIKDNAPIDPAFGRPQADFANVDVVSVATVGAQQQHQGQTQSGSSAQVPSSQAQSDHIQHSHHHHHHPHHHHDSDQTDHVSGAQSSETTSEKKGRHVSNTKRAAQNRSAQKAFRVRREKYIKDLEQSAAEVGQLKQTIEELRAENLQLRDYTLALQSRVIELSSNQPPQSQDHIPPPPAAVYSASSRFNQEK